MKHSWPIIQLKTVDSTNNYANSLLSDNLNVTECVIAASKQLEGRGQKGNSWFSNENENLTFSIILNTSYLKAENQFLLSQCISLGILSFLNKHNIEAKVKWPNDIFVGNDKIAGILIENSIIGEYLSNSIIGIGLNVNQLNFESLFSSATSMKKLKLIDFNCQALLDDLLSHIWQKIELLKKNDSQFIRAEYINNVYCFDEWTQFQAGNESFEAKIIDISPFGELVILSADGKMRKFLFQEIKMLHSKKS